MGNPVASLLSLYKCDMSDAGGTHIETPIFFPSSSKVKVLKMNVVLQGDMALCPHRNPTPSGSVAVPMPNPVQKGSLTVKFGEKPAARQKDMLSHGGKISKGIPLVKIG